MSTVYSIDLSAPANDGILDVAAFETFLHDRIKVNGVTNNLSDSVGIERSAKNKSVVSLTIAPSTHFPKRYIKYLTKKFLKKNQIRDYLRVIANTKTSYEIRYFDVDQGADEEEDDE